MLHRLFLVLFLSSALSLAACDTEDPPGNDTSSGDTSGGDGDGTGGDTTGDTTTGDTTGDTTGGDGDGDTTGDDTTGDTTGGDGDGDGDGDTTGGDGDGDGDGDGGAELPPIVGPLEDPGPFDVAIIDPVKIDVGRNREVTAAICAPSDDGGNSVADGPFALVVTSPGATFGRETYASYCEHLASWGFFVINQNLIGNGFFPPSNHAPLAVDTSGVIDWALSGSGYEASIDPTKIAVAGHSLGGKVSFLTAAGDDRIGAIVGWDPVDANGPLTRPNSPDYTSATPELVPDIVAKVAVVGETLSQGGFMACAPAEDNFEQYYEFAKGPAIEVEIPDADHQAWTDGNGDCGVCRPCGSTPKATVRAITRKVNIAWFRRHLFGDLAMDDVLSFGDGAGAGLVTVQSK